MKKILYTGLVAAALSPMAANAQTRDGFYVGAMTGLNLATDADFEAAGVTADVDYDHGWGLLGQAGYAFGQFRVEAELGWRTNEVDSVSGIAGGGGNTDALSLMGNVYWDIPTGSAFTPYIGAGLGYAQVEFDDIAGGAINDDDGGFAYQGILGVAYALNDNLSLKADYRYFATQDLDVKNAAGVSTDAEYAAHSVMVGFSWKFGQAAEVVETKPSPPPPPPPPPPAFQKNYMVFFDFDKSDVKPEARAIVEQAAANSKKGGTSRINVTGHADRSGTDQYNMALSQRRADAIKAELVRLGVPANQIVTVAKGESSPLVATKDGVREPQNRRVEIVLQ